MWSLGNSFELRIVRCPIVLRLLAQCFVIPHISRACLFFITVGGSDHDTLTSPSLIKEHTVASTTEPHQFNISETTELLNTTDIDGYEYKSSNIVTNETRPTVSSMQLPEGEGVGKSEEINVKIKIRYLIW